MYIHKNRYRLFCIIGFTVVGKPAATVATSSPSLICLSPSVGEQRVLNAIKLAEEPELTVIRCLTPKNLESFFKLTIKSPSS